MIEDKAIKEVIDSHSFVELKGDIKENNSYKTFLIDVQTEEGQPPLQWEVRIAPFYPLKVDNSESIYFFNTSLIAYPHIMRSGFLCLHTPKVENSKEQFKIDILHLKEWGDKYYVRKEKDEHYEELVVAHNLIVTSIIIFSIQIRTKSFPRMTMAQLT